MQGIFSLTGFFLIVLLFFMQWEVYVKKIIITFSVSSFILSGFLLYLGIVNEEHILIALSALTAAVRGFFIPYIMFYSLRKDTWRARESEPLMGTATSILISVLIVIFAYILYRSTLYEFIKVPEGSLPIALMLQGSFLMISRRNTFIQMVGYMVMENAVILFSGYIFPGLPFVIEAGVILDLIGIVMIFALLMQIRENTVSSGAPDSYENIEELKG